jgi:hypothetical protein
MNNLKRYISLVLIQFILVFIGFKRFFIAPLDQMFCNSYDGFKNYLTFHAYIQQKDFSTIYHHMNFPFGDFISFTDNTPLLAGLFKSLTVIFPSLASYDIVFFNTVCLLGIILTAFILLKIFELLEIPLMIAFPFAIILPWVSPQLERFYNGHFNLSFSWIIPLAIYMLLKFYKQSLTEVKISNLKLFMSWFVFLVSITFIHIYYLAIVGVFAGVFAFIWLMKDWVEKRRFVTKSPALVLLISLVLAGSLAMIILWGMDPKPELRQAFAEGYGFEAWKLNFPAVYTAPDFIPYRKWLGFENYSFPYESYMYLGSAFLLGVIVFFISFKNWKNYIESPYFTVILIFSVSGFISLCISIGEDSWTKFFNPFYYLHFLTERVEQFRCISRFGWSFFWTVNIGIVYYIGTLWKNRTFKILSIIIFLAGIFDVYFILKKAETSQDFNIFHEKYINADTQEILKRINIQQYQAILPIPYYHVGCENYDFTIDPEEDFFKFTSMLSLATHLPNMGCKMSRTPVIEAQALLSLFYPTIGQRHYLFNKLDINKKVLVVYDKTFYSELKEDQLPQREIPKNVILNGKTFVEKLPLLSENDRYAIYEWSPTFLPIQ